MIPPRSGSRRPSWTRLGVAALTIAMAGSACSPGPADDGEANGTTGSDLAYTDGGPLEEGELDAELVDDDGLPTLPSISPDTGGTPTTLGSGLPPVTTLPPSRGGDPDGLYRGTLGRLGPDESVTAGAALPPAVEPGVQPLTGLAGDVPDRPAAVVKIDNGPAAAPHTGLNAADIVVEEEVEGGVTRFAAIFHSTSSIVGPVRSGRTTDVAIVGGLGDPLLLYSGANDVTQAILWAQPALQLRGEGWSSGFWRDPARRAPSNLYTDTAPHWASAFGAPPPPQFHYRDADRSATGSEVEEFTVAYPSSSVRWAWEGGAWRRWQRGAEHLLANGQQVAAANVVVIEADEVATGLVDASGGPVPEFVFVGSGPATVFTDGKRIEGTWTRPTLTSVATLTSGPGRPIELTRGRTWIQLVETGTGVASS